MSTHVYTDYKEYLEAENIFMNDIAHNPDWAKILYGQKDYPNRPQYNATTKEQLKEIIDTVNDSDKNSVVFADECIHLLGQKVSWGCGYREGILKGLVVCPDDFYYIIEENSTDHLCSCVGEIKKI